MPKVQKTLISSFHNEEYLLPWWLEHHKQILDHAVLFDYFSTDRSVEIIKDICPTWEVRETANTDWDFRANDAEFMAAEREFDGYKMVLTTSEFLVGEMPELSPWPMAYMAKFIRMVDDEPDREPVYGTPLIDQKNYGYLDRSYMHRILHSYKDGWYRVGRHVTKHDRTASGLRVAKYSFSPWTEKMKKRKLSFSKFVNPKDIKRKWGLHHVWDRERLEEEYKSLLSRDDMRHFVLHGQPTGQVETPEMAG